MMLLGIGGVDGSTQFLTPHHSLAPNLPAILVSMTEKMEFSSYKHTIRVGSDRNLLIGAPVLNELFAECLVRNTIKTTI